jgi:AcrR family transcriptional regulator
MDRRFSAKGEATRQRMIHAAALLIRENGAAETSLDEVLAATSTSKSQLFHYFPAGRADLLVAVAAHEAAQVLEAQEPYLSDLSSPDAWLQWRQAVVDHYAELGDRCPLGALTSELGKTSPATRVIVTELYDTWEAAIARGVTALLGDNSEQADIARSILAAIQGGVVMLRATGRVDYLDTALTRAVQALTNTASSKGQTRRRSGATSRGLQTAK